jgi:hypothetical protein
VTEARRLSEAPGEARGGELRSEDMASGWKRMSRMRVYCVGLVLGGQLSRLKANGVVVVVAEDEQRGRGRRRKVDTVGVGVQGARAAN